MEAKFNNKDIIEKTRESQLSSKRAYKKARTGSVERAAQTKIERDNSRIETLVEVEQKPYSRLVSFYESKKSELLKDSTINNE
jgi:hypothetical protein